MRKFNPGDEVRLVRGYTKMIVLGYVSERQCSYQDHIVAKYASYGVLDSDFEQPLSAYHTKRRYQNDFVFWDGEDETKDKKVITKFRNKINNDVFEGQLLNRSSNGSFVIELTNTKVVVYSSSEVEEIKPVVFSCKGINGRFTTTYIAPTDSCISVGDVLVSSSNNMYIVTGVNVDRNAAREFKGYRLMRGEL